MSSVGWGKGAAFNLRPMQSLLPGPVESNSLRHLRRGRFWVCSPSKLPNTFVRSCHLPLQEDRSEAGAGPETAKTSAIPKALLKAVERVLYLFILPAIRQRIGVLEDEERDGQLVPVGEYCNFAGGPVGPNARREV